MNWYRVTKTIRGRKYDYWQKTYRVGRSVKTLNKYIGPTGRHALPISVNTNPSTKEYVVITEGSKHSVCINEILYHFTSETAATAFKSKCEAKLLNAQTFNPRTEYERIVELFADAPLRPREPDPIVRMNDLTTRQQKEYMKESMKKIKQENQHRDLDVLEYSLSKMTPENQQSYLRAVMDNPEPGTIADLITPEFLARYNVEKTPSKEE
jgi:hypothetical protein